MNQHLGKGRAQAPARDLENPASKPIFYDETGAADYLAGEKPLSIKTVQAWRHRGTGPTFYKIGRLVRYLKSDLDDYLRSRVCNSTSERPGGAAK